jgi:ketosteroid isomerase-like protein
MRSLLMLVCVVAIAGCGGRSHKASTPAPSDAMDAARRAVETWRAAWEADSYGSIAPLYAHDPSLVMVEQGVAYTGWDKVDARLKEVLGHAREIHVKLQGIQVAELDDASAVVVASMDRDISDGTVTTSERGILTLVLHHDGGSWVVVSEHYSYPHST